MTEEFKEFLKGPQPRERQPVYPIANPFFFWLQVVMLLYLIISAIT